MAGKRIDMSTLAVEPREDAPAPPRLIATPHSARVDQVAANPLNTRDVYANPEAIAGLAASIREHGQLQPCTVVASAAFVALFPEHAPAVARATWVQVTGGRRRAALIEAGRDTIDIVVKPDLAESRTAFVSATMVENIHRADLDPVEEARAVQLLAKESGSNKAAGEKLNRTGAWVTQRLNLLELAEQVQEALRAPEPERLPLREVRTLHKATFAEQLAFLEVWRAGGLTAVNPPEDGSTGDEPPAGGLTAVNRDGRVGERPAAATPTGRVPSQRLSPAARAISRLGPTPVQIAAALRAELPPADRKVIAEELMRDL